MAQVQDAINQAISKHAIPKAIPGNGFKRKHANWTYSVTVSALLNLGWEMEDAQDAADKHTGCVTKRVLKAIKGARL